MPDQSRRDPGAVRNRAHRRGMKPAFRNQIERGCDQILAATFFTFPTIGAAVCHAGPFLLYDCVIQPQYETEIGGVASHSDYFV